MEHDPATIEESTTASLASTRRELLGDAGKIAAAGAIALGFDQAGVQVAAGADGEEVSDVDVLNFALSLELLETEFYTRGFERFDQRDFQKARFMRGFGFRMRRRVRDDVLQILENEQTHAEVLRDVIERRGGEPVEKREYEFPLADPTEFIATARDIENTGVTAYNGAISLIDDTELQTQAATIATVEARHGAYLKLLTDQVPHPEAFDGTRTMDEVLDIVDQFIVS